MKKSILVLNLLFLVSCGEPSFEKENKKNNADQVTIPVSELERNLQVKVDTTDEPGKYLVTFAWPKLVDNKSLRISQNGLLSEVSSVQQFFSQKVSHNQFLNYSFQVISERRALELSFKKGIQIPRDLFDSQTLEVNDAGEARYNRIFLKKDTPVYSDGKDVKIIANEIHSVDGSIETMPEKIEVTNKDGTKTEVTNEALLETPGASGGKLTIVANKLIGKMTVVMRGQKGGRGGVPPRKEGRGPAGNPGHFDFHSGGRSKLDPDESQGFCIGYEFGNGGPGAKGYIGKTGFPGGASGDLRLQIKSAQMNEQDRERTGISDLVEVKFIPGVGGDGGAGGLGQLGGLPSENRARSDERCRGHEHRNSDGRLAVEGPVGPDGDTGLQGPEGSIGTKCIYIESENYNACD